MNRQARGLERVDSHVQDLAGEMEVMRNTARPTAFIDEAGMPIRAGGGFRLGCCASQTNLSIGPQLSVHAR